MYGDFDPYLAQLFAKADRQEDQDPCDLFSEPEVDANSLRWSVIATVVTLAVLSIWAFLG